MHSYDERGRLRFTLAAGTPTAVKVAAAAAAAAGGIAVALRLFLGLGEGTEPLHAGAFAARSRELAAELGLVLRSPAVAP